MASAVHLCLLIGLALGGPDAPAGQLIPRVPDKLPEGVKRDMRQIGSEIADEIAGKVRLAVGEAIQEKVANFVGPFLSFLIAFVLGFVVVWSFLNRRSPPMARCLVPLLLTFALAGCKVEFQSARPPTPATPLPINVPIPLAPPSPWDGKPCPPVGGSAKVGGNVSPDGAEEVNCDLPSKFHIKNRGGSDGAGLCVFASLKHSSIWQHVYPTQDIFEWMFDKPGGGWPEKVDQQIKALCAKNGQPIPDYVQVESRDLEVLKLACKTGRMPAVTYCYSPTGRYGGRRISHMVTLVHATEKWFGVVDNNYPGSIEWMDPQTFLNVTTGGPGRRAWFVIFLDPGPPPAPRPKAR